MDDNTSKKAMTDEERLALAAKLDTELDEFMSGLEKRQYTEGWPEDRWQEEFEKHPFFMTKAPEPGDELHPLLEGIQKLKYDPEENTAEELAVSYKDDGNFNFKYKKYRLAILSYTEGIKQKHNNTELSSNLYNNRAAANFYLKNYRSCIRDCLIALKLNPNYQKAQIRLSQAYFELSNWDKCIEVCDNILEQSENSQTLELRQKAVLGKKTEDRDKRRRGKQENIKKTETNSLLSEIKRRGVKLISDNLIPIVPQLQDVQVHFSDKNDELIWPVCLVYPEIGTIDFIREFSERNSFHDQLKEVFEEPSSWDTTRRYKIDSINIYFEQISENGVAKLHSVSLEDTLGQTIARREYFVKDGTPNFFILVKESNAETNFIKQYK